MPVALVAGAAGFIGANLVRRLIRDGYTTHVIVRPQSTAWRLDGIRNDVESHGLLLEDGDAVDALFGRVRPDAAFNLAAYGAYSSQRDVRRMVQTNVVGTANFVQAALAHDVPSVVHAGTSSEYGFSDHAPTEYEGLNPNSYYAATKAAGSLFCRHAGSVGDTQVTTLRLYSAYGPWEEPTRLIPTLVLSALRGTLPPLVSPNVARDFVYVDDVVEAFVLAASPKVKEPGAVFNVGTGTQTRLADLVDLIRHRFSIVDEPAWGSMADREWDTAVWVAEPAVIKSTLAWRPQVGLAEGLDRVATWLRDEPGALHRYETDRRLPA